MAESLGDAVLELRVDKSSYSRDLGSAEREAQTFTSRGTKMFGGLAKGAAFGAVGAAVGGLGLALHAGIGEWSQSTKVSAQTQAVLKSTGGAAGVTAKQVSTLSNSLMMKSGVDDEAIQSGENLLLTFTQIQNKAGEGNDIFNQATGAMLDMSVALGQDSSQSAIQLGKALNDPIKGVTALRRVGVSFTKAQMDQIKTMAESGNVMGAQKLILKELNKEFGGSAEMVGKTLPGKFNILKERAMNALGALVGKAADWIQLHWDDIVKVLKEIGQTASDMGKIVGAVFKFLEPYIMGFINTVKGMMMILHGIMSGDWSQVWEGIKTIFKAQIDAMIGMAQNMLGVITGIFSALGTAILDFLSPIGTTFADTWNTVKTATETTWNTIKSFLIDTIWNPIKTAVTTAVNAVQTAITTVWDAIKTATDTVWNGIKTFLTTVIWTPLQTAATTTWNAIKLAITTVVNAIKLAVTTVWNAIKLATTTTWNAIKTAITTAINAAKTVVSTAVNAIKTVASGAFNALKGAVVTEWNNIKNTITTAINAAKTAVQKAVGAIKTALNDAISGVNKFIRGWNGFRVPYPTLSIEISYSNVLGVDVPTGIHPHFGVGYINMPNIPTIPKLGEGGIAMSPTLAMLGEKGPEAIVPLNQMNQMTGGWPERIVLEVDKQVLAEITYRELLRRKSRNTNLGVA